MRSENVKYLYDATILENRQSALKCRSRLRVQPRLLHVKAQRWLGLAVRIMASFKVRVSRPIMGSYRFTA